MGRQTVKILVEGTKVVCDPDPLEINRMDGVSFECDYPFAVHFSQRSPFSKMSYRKKHSTEDDNPNQTSNKIQPDVAYGTYKYFIAVYKPDADQVLTADPDIIIVPEP
jgi:hypothetical protein